MGKIFGGAPKMPGPDPNLLAQQQKAAEDAAKAKADAEAKAKEEEEQRKRNQRGRSSLLAPEDTGTGFPGTPTLSA